MTDFLDRPTAVRAGEELDIARLEPFLRSRFPAAEAGFSVQQFPSGHSNLTYLVQLGGIRMVLRRPPFGSKVKSAHDMGREFRVLSKLHDAYPPAPKVLLHCDDQSILGAPFYLMEPVNGIILRREPPAGLAFTPETARSVCEALIENLARMHRIDYAAIGLEDLGKPQGYVERQVRGWTERYYGSKTHEIAEVEHVAQWMQRNLPVSSDATLIHNDYKFDNVVLDPGNLAHIIGVLDWEMCTIGDPLSDLGSTLAYWVEAKDSAELQTLRWGPTNYPGSMTRRELAERYGRITHRDVSNLAFYLVFARFKLAVIVQQIYYRYHLGLTKDPRFARMQEAVEILMRAAWECAQTGTL
ncbi:MAG TPA: phosphotransferase family protein [Candidatus Methylomirabilis sp.]|nr:phosphotransferase family protein [Candidatus Methylomirabilis sp.]